MPLKEPDLKDTDTYKKASRVDLPKVASGNAKFWIYKDVELPNASGKKQKYPAFLALVDDNGIRKAMTGKKLICKGTCGMKKEKIAFEATTGTVPYKQLKASLASAAADEEVGADGVNLGSLNNILDQLDTRLIDKLDEALNAEDPAQRQQYNLQAKGIIGEYMTFVNSNALMADIDESGFTPVAVRKTAVDALTNLSSNLLI